MSRTTRKTLETLVCRINDISGIDGSLPLWIEVGGTLRARVGMFYLEHGLNGYTLARMSNDGGGTTDYSPTLPAGSMELVLRAMIRGMEVVL